MDWHWLQNPFKHSPTMPIFNSKAKLQTEPNDGHIIDEIADKYAVGLASVKRFLLSRREVRNLEPRKGHESSIKA